MAIKNTWIAIFRPVLFLKMKPYWHWQLCCFNKMLNMHTVTFDVFTRHCFSTNSCYSFPGMIHRDCVFSSIELKMISSWNQTLNSLWPTYLGWQSVCQGSAQRLVPPAYSISTSSVPLPAAYIQFFPWGITFSCQLLHLKKCFNFRATYAFCLALKWWNTDTHTHTYVEFEKL